MHGEECIAGAASNVLFSVFLRVLRASVVGQSLDAAAAAGHDTRGAS